MMTTSVEDWSCENVASWLQEAGFENYCHLFCETHKIDGQALLSLTEADLKQPPLDIKVSSIHSISIVLLTLLCSYFCLV